MIAEAGRELEASRRGRGSAEELAAEALEAEAEVTPRQLRSVAEAIEADETAAELVGGGRSRGALRPPRVARRRRRELLEEAVPSAASPRPRRAPSLAADDDDA